MYKLLSPKDRQAEVEAQIEELGDCNFYAQRGADFEKKLAFADLIFERVDIAQNRFNPVPMLFERRPGQLGVQVKSHRYYGARVYHRTYGEFKRASTIMAKTYTVTTSPKSVVVPVIVEQIRTGVITASDIVGLILSALDRHKVDLAWSTWRDALTAGGAYCDDFTTSIGQTALEAAINEVADLSGTPGAVLARRTLLTPITGFKGYDQNTGYPEEVKREIHNTGQMGAFSGTQLVSMLSWEDELYSEAVIDATDILVMPNAARLAEITRFAEVGGVQRAMTTNPRDGTVEFLMDIEDGAAVWEPKYARRLRKTA